MNKEIDNKKLELKKRKKEQFLTNALKKDTFNGRRYLGTSKFGKDIWIIMRFNKEDMQISLEIDGKLDDLKDPDATLAPVRISQRLNRPKPNINDYIRLNRKNAGGQVTLRTIQYIEKLIIKICKKNPKPLNQKGKVVKFYRLTNLDNKILNKYSLKEIYDRIRMVDGEGYKKAYIKFGNYEHQTIIWLATDSWPSSGIISFCRMAQHAKPL